MLKCFCGIMTVLLAISAQAQTRFIPEAVPPIYNDTTHPRALCLTAESTLRYVQNQQNDDPLILQGGQAYPIALDRIKATLTFICAHQNEMKNPAFVRDHFDFVRWYPDEAQANKFAQQKTLLQHRPREYHLLTKYYVHESPAAIKPSKHYSYPLYGLPKDEAALSYEEAEKNPRLIRYRFGKQAILKGALNNYSVPVLAYFNREDLEAALMEGTVVARFQNGQKTKIFNVHRNNHIAYHPNLKPYAQERYWFFREVDGIKGYGKDADHKISVVPTATFAGNLADLGLGRLLLVRYKNNKGLMLGKIGVLADTGGAFDHNLYQLDYLAGVYPGRESFNRATKNLPDYVQVWLLVVKKKYQ